MRPLGSGERDLLRGSGNEAPRYATHKRLYLGDTLSVVPDVFGHVLVRDVLGYEPLLDAVWGANGNELCGDATFTLNMGRGSKRLTHFGLDLDLNAGRANKITPSPGRYIQLQTATVPRGAIPGEDDFHRVFDGRIDTVDITDGEIRLGCRDLMCDFVDRWIQHNDAGQFHGWWLAGGTLGATLTQLVDDLLFPDGSRSVIGLGTTPGFTYPGFWQSPMSGGDAIQAIVDKLGYVIHMRYEAAGGEAPALTYYDPNYVPEVVGMARDTQTVRERINTTLRLDRRNVRNVIYGQYGPDRATRFNINSLSVAEYGPRYLLFDEEKTSLINTEAEMDDMIARAALRVNTADVGSQVVRPYFWPIELSDAHFLEPDGHKFDTELSVRVGAYRHELTRQHERTTITYAENSLAAVRRLLTNKPKTFRVDLIEPIGMAPEGFSWGLTDTLDPPAGSSPP